MTAGSVCTRHRDRGVSHLISPLDRRRAAQPDLVALELGRDEGDDLLEVDALARLEVAPELGRERRFEH